METLSETWFIEGNIDFESKKYTLLAYLMKVNAFFDDRKLYPALADIVMHYRNLTEFKKNKRLLQNLFPKRLTGIQLQKLELLYEEMITDDALMCEIEEIVHYASRKLKTTISGATDLYDYVESHLTIEPVGILPLNVQEGYFFLNDGFYRSIRVYHYCLSIFERSSEKYRALRAQYISDWERNFTNSYESIKWELMRNHKSMTAPAVYAIETKLTYPMEETLLPIAKRCLVRHLSK
jgi:hypothetical protein